jgi:CRP/FNR family transcriptional regulator, anaerobic regulatory protein
MDALLLLRQVFQQYGFSETEAADIAGYFQWKSYKKGDYFVQEGQTGHYLGFVAQGAFQYFVLADGEERSTYVTPKHAFVASLISFLEQTPAREYIRCIADAEVALLHRSQLQTLQNKIPGFRAFYTGLLEYLIVCIEKSRLDFITLNAEQRYDKMMREEPELLQQIPLQYLASILGVTPRHLSRIRSR